MVWLLLVFVIWDYASRNDEPTHIKTAIQNTTQPLIPSIDSVKPNSYAPIVNRVLPKVVSVITESNKAEQNLNWFMNPFFQDNRQQERLPSQAGSGVVVSDKGHIITNYHVIAGSDVITVRYLGEDIEADIVGFDSGTDLALLKIDRNTQPIAFSNSDNAQVGDVVLAIGNPFNIGETVTQGIISALGRNLQINTFEDYIQTDAAISTGNSGGPLINTAGELVGINSVIISSSGGSEGVAFAISSNLTYDVFAQLLKKRKVVRGYFGVVVRNTQNGVEIINIAPNTGAAVSGLRIGDRIVEVGGVKIENTQQMIQVISAYKPHDKVSVTVDRAGRYETLEVVVSERPQRKL